MKHSHCSECSSFFKIFKYHLQFSLLAVCQISISVLNCLCSNSKSSTALAKFWINNLKQFFNWVLNVYVQFFKESFSHLIRLATFWFIYSVRIKCFHSFCRAQNVSNLASLTLHLISQKFISVILLDYLLLPLFTINMQFNYSLPHLL